MSALDELLNARGCECEVKRGTRSSSVRIGRIRTTPKGALTPLRGLTHSLDTSKEGLAVNATRAYSHDGDDHPRHDGSPAKYQARAQRKFAAHFDRLVSPWAIIQTSCETSQCLRPQCMTVLEPVKIEYPAGTCVYCGEGASGVDHLMPRAVTGEQFRSTVAIVPCCAHCNATINDTFAVSVTERRRVCHERLRRNGKRLLNSPDRAPDELRRMGHVLRESAKAHRLKKQLLLARLEWPRDPDYDRRAFERTGIFFAEELGLI